MICPACDRITRNLIFEDRGYEAGDHYTVDFPGLCDRCEDLEVRAKEQELYEEAS